MRYVALLLLAICSFIIERPVEKPRRSDVCPPIVDTVAIAGIDALYRAEHYKAPTDDTITLRARSELPLNSSSAPCSSHRRSTATSPTACARRDAASP